MKPESQSDRHAEGIAGRRVDARGGLFAGAHARLEEVLRLEVTLVEKIIYREVEVHERAGVAC